MMMNKILVKITHKIISKMKSFFKNKLHKRHLKTFFFQKQILNNCFIVNISLNNT